MANDLKTGGVLPRIGASLRRFWAVVLVILLACLSAIAVLQQRGPDYEAQAVVRVRLGADVLGLIEAHLMGRDALSATAARHDIPNAVALRQSVGLHPLTALAGATLGLAPDVAGVVISVRLPQADLAAMVANDLALQVLDLGQSGQLDANHDALTFYASEEQRLWQEIAALKAEMSGVRVRAERDSSGGDRPLILLQDQYDVVRQHLAEEQVAARLADHRRAGDFVLLQRAKTGLAVGSGNIWLLALLSGAIALALAAAFLSHHAAALQRAITAEGAVFGLPRFAVISALAISALITLSLLLR